MLRVVRPYLTVEQSQDAAAAAAVEKTFNVVELLEMILLELPVKQLLFLPRVCKHWCAVIKTSKTLQRALFFEPLPGGPTELVFYPRGSFFAQDETLFSYSEICQDEYAISPADYDFLNKDASALNVDGVPHGAVDRNSNVEKSYMRAVRVYKNPFEEHLLSKGTKLDRHLSFDSIHASWRRMLICQPAMKIVNVFARKPTNQHPHSYVLTDTYQSKIEGERLRQLTKEWTGWQKVPGELARNVRLSEHVVRYLPLQEYTPYLIQDDGDDEEAI